MHYHYLRFDFAYACTVKAASRRDIRRPFFSDPLQRLPNRPKGCPRAVPEDATQYVECFCSPAHGTRGRELLLRFKNILQMSRCLSMINGPQPTADWDGIVIHVSGVSRYTAQLLPQLFTDVHIISLRHHQLLTGTTKLLKNLLRQMSYQPMRPPALWY